MAVVGLADCFDILGVVAALELVLAANRESEPVRQGTEGRALADARGEQLDIRGGDEERARDGTNYGAADAQISSMVIVIKRIGPSRLSATRSRTVIHQGVMTAVAVLPDKTPSLYQQARAALAVLDPNLPCSHTVPHQETRVRQGYGMRRPEEGSSVHCGARRSSSRV